MAETRPFLLLHLFVLGNEATNKDAAMSSGTFSLYLLLSICLCSCLSLSFSVLVSVSLFSIPSCTVSFFFSLFLKIAAAFTSQEQKLYASAGAVAEEVLSSVKTVVAFGGEFKESARYSSQPFFTNGLNQIPVQFVPIWIRTV